MNKWIKARRKQALPLFQQVSLGNPGEETAASSHA